MDFPVLFIQKKAEQEDKESGNAKDRT
jgi:hypothetical protein